MIDKTNIHRIENASVRDRDGASVGKVKQVFPADEDGHAQFVSVATGLLGRRESVVPVDDATFDGMDVHVGFTKDAIGDAPELGHDRTLSPSAANAVRRHFGMSPTGQAVGDMGDPHENLESGGLASEAALDQAGTGPAGADDTEGAGATPPNA